MRTLALVACLSLSVCLLVLVSSPLAGAVAPKKAASAAAGSATDEGTTPAAETATKSADAPADQPQQSRIEKEVLASETKWMALQTQEMTLSTGIMGAQMQANQLVTDPPDKVAEKFAKPGGGLSANMAQYKQIMLKAAQQYAAFDNQLAAVLKSLKFTDHEKESAPADLKTRLDAAIAKYTAKHRTILERVAEIYDRVAEYRPALQAYTADYQLIPEKERAKEKKLIEKLGDLSDKCGDFKNAVLYYKILFDATPEAQRWKNWQFNEKFADVLVRAGDPADALQIYQQTLAAMDANTKKDHGKSFQQKISSLGGTTPTPPKAATATPAATAGGGKHW